MPELITEIPKNYFRLEETLRNVKRLVILTHNNPDPDAISSAVTLAYIVKTAFKIPVTVKYSGIIGRAENLAMVRILKLRLKALTEADFKSPGVEYALVDTQPKTGNSPLPKNRKPLIVIDHHPLRKTTKADFIDIRSDYGATATILTEYLIHSTLEIPSQIATALSYGISSETQDLGREAGEPDIMAHLALFHHTNKRHLAQIVHPKLSRDYFIILNRALHHSRIYKNAIATTLGEIPNPDFVPFIADVMVRCERITWAFCIGRYENQLIMSIRAQNPKAKAGAFLRRLVGTRGTAGGHGMIAGGQIKCASMDHEKCTELEESLIGDFLKKLGHKDIAETTPLLVREPIHS